MNNSRETMTDYLSPAERQLLEEIKHRAKENQSLISRLALHESSQIDSESYRLKIQIENDKKQLDVLKQKAAIRRAVKEARTRATQKKVASFHGKAYGIKKSESHHSANDE